MERILREILQRDHSLFQQDILNNKNNLHNMINGTRIMVIGAAGSIGRSFVRQILDYKPGSLHLIDISENNLVELVRNIRSSLIEIPNDFKTYAVALGSQEFEMLIKSQKPYDYIVNFSALKHVRSEKDPFTLIRMYNTNVYYVKQLMDMITEKPIKKHFSVSSDKATQPASIMGATKIFMERVLLSYSEKIPFSTARFANVAFSDGSLLYGFLQRIALNQPIAAPNDVKRYFISHQEAGELCLLSCFLGENRDVFFPKLDENADLITFSDIAVKVLESKGLDPFICDSEEEAKRYIEKRDKNSNAWPCYFFKSDTTGEKPFEEFYTSDDNVDFNLYSRVGVIKQKMFTQIKQLDQAIDIFEKIKQSKEWNKADMVRTIQIIVPELMHEEKYKDLDQKM